MAEVVRHIHICEPEGSRDRPGVFPVVTAINGSTVALD